MAPSLPAWIDKIKLSKKKARPANGVVKKQVVKKVEKKAASGKLQDKWQKFFDRSVEVPAPIAVDDRPLPLGIPPVWANARQALCEAVPYYKKYQGASYTTGGFAVAMLLGKDCGELAHMDEQVIITRAGGCCESVEGRTTQVRDHVATEGEVRSFIASMNAGLPIILIIGNDNLTCPVKLERRYSVLGHFQVTHVWPELTRKGIKSFKYRFEKVDLGERSWWAEAGSAAPAPAANRPQLPFAGCASCGSVSPKIYENGWMCLNVICSEFFKINGAQISTNLKYSQEFIDCRQPWPVNAPALQSLTPSIPQDATGQVYTRDSHNGMVCPACKCCTIRKYWDHWQCDCGHIQFPAQRHIQIQSLVGPMKIKRNNMYQNPVMQCPEVSWGNYRVVQYNIPSIGSAIWHLKASDVVNSLPGGPDDMFAAFEGDSSIGLQRWPRSQGNVAGEFYSTNYTRNFGLNYKFAVAVESKPFRDAPPAIIAGLQRLTWAGHNAIESLTKLGVARESFIPFNELMAIGYVESGKMDYHDDGEFGLGPTVASLSLGGAATMHFRMKRQAYCGLNKNYTYEIDGDVLEGSLNQERREDYNYIIDDLPKLNEEEKLTAIKQMYGEWWLNGGRLRNSPDVLKLDLKHGDIMVMHGHQLQQYYEHAVRSEDKLRFVMTSRHINPDTVEKEDRSMGDYDLKESMRYNGE